MNEIKEKIRALGLSRINPDKVEDKGTYYLVTIYGGFNGGFKSPWALYFKQLQEIVDIFDSCWVIDLKNDILDDCWVVRIGVRK